MSQLPAGQEAGQDSAKAKATTALASVAVFASDASWMEPEALVQCRQVAVLDGMVHVAAMPDPHPGKGRPYRRGPARAVPAVLVPRRPVREISPRYGQQARHHQEVGLPRMASVPHTAGRRDAATGPSTAGALLVCVQREVR